MNNLINTDILAATDNKLYDSFLNYGRAEILNRAYFNELASKIFIDNRDFAWSYKFTPISLKLGYDVVVCQHDKLTNTLQKRFLVELKTRSTKYDSAMLERNKYEPLMRYVNKYERTKAAYIFFYPSEAIFWKLDKPITEWEKKMLPKVSSQKSNLIEKEITYLKNDSGLSVQLSMADKWKRINLSEKLIEDSDYEYLRHQQILDLMHPINTDKNLKPFGTIKPEQVNGN